MEISFAILKPNLLKIQHDYLSLYSHMQGSSDNETLELKQIIENQLLLIDRLGAKLSMEMGEGNAVPAFYFESFRKLKMHFRFSERRWRLVISNAARNRKMRERVNHAAPVAA